MSQNAAVEALVTQREKLVSERDRMIESFNTQISEIESSIETLSGRKVWDVISETRFDDESPHYIKSSEEEI
jgi:hypothetical protein